MTAIGGKETDQRIYRKKNEIENDKGISKISNETEGKKILVRYLDCSGNKPRFYGLESIARFNRHI